MSISRVFLSHEDIGIAQLDGLHGTWENPIDDDWGYPHDLGNLHDSSPDKIHFVSVKSSSIAMGVSGTPEMMEETSGI